MPAMPTLAHYLAWRVVRGAPALELDLADTGLQLADLEAAAPRLHAALAAMQRLEAGAIANADEQRRVGHYWLRAPELAPEPSITAQILASWDQIDRFAADILGGTITAPDGQPFTATLLVGIGGSALGPQLLADALGGRLHVLDNTDPDGIDRTLASLDLARHTLVLVISKSGGTPRRATACSRSNAPASSRASPSPASAVAVTGPGSNLDTSARTSRAGSRRFPLWDWVGGRTSITSAVGLLARGAARHGLRAFLAGAAAMDDATRAPTSGKTRRRCWPSFWHHEGRARAKRAMVVLPYKDRLLLLSRYLQQLVMESLGKRLDRQGREVVHQGLAVYGNKGSTDQHAYVQQLRDGRPTSSPPSCACCDRAGVRPLRGRTRRHLGDFLDGFWQGTRAALPTRAARRRPSPSIASTNATSARPGAVRAHGRRSTPN
jgi:glucose-6-phosphate isomerase